MITQIGDLFNLGRDAWGICIPTNGTLKTNGELVMGAGVARIAANKYPDLARNLGKKVKASGNHVYLGISRLSTSPYKIISFPTKEHWKNPSTITLIRQSAIELVGFTNQYDLNPQLDRVYLPVVGCGLGGLNWDLEVKPVLEEILDERFTVIFTKR